MEDGCLLDAKGSVSQGTTFLLDEWHRHLLGRGWSVSSARRAVARLRAFGRSSERGLLNADRADVVRYAQARAVATETDLPQLIRTEAWRQWVRAVRSFYRWLGENFQPAPRDPTTGLWLPPSRSKNCRVTPRKERLYEKVLNAPVLSKRDQTVLYLLAHGILAKEISRLRIEDVDLARRRVVVRSRTERIVPLSQKAVGHLRLWLTVHRHDGSRPTPLYPSYRAGSCLSVSAIRAVVRRAAHAVFRGPGEEKRRRDIHAYGFREVFLARVARTRIAPGALRALTGVDRLSRLAINSCVAEELAHRDLARLVRRWPRWL